MVDKQHTDELNTLLNEARHLHDEGNIRQAIERLESSEAYRDSARVLSLIAHYYYLLEEFETASTAARKALEIAPRNRLALQTLGEVQMKTRHYSEAEGWFREAIESNPRTPHPFLRLAASLISQRFYDKAADVLYKGLETFSGHPELLERLQFALTMDGRTQEAAQIRKTRLQSASSDQPDMRLLLNRFEGLELNRAISQLKILESMEHYQDQASLHDLLAKKLLEAERYEEAIPVLKKLLEIQNRNDRARLNLALCYAKTGAVETAVSLLETLERYRTDEQFMLVKAEVLMAQHRWDEALAVCMILLKEQPRNKRFRKLLQVLKRKGARPSPSAGS